NGVGIAVTEAGGPSTGIRFANTGNWTPEIVVVFRFPNGHSGIGHGDVCQGEQARKLNGAHSSLVGNLHRDLIVQSRRRAQAWGTIVSPENADECLLFRALVWRNAPIATDVFH